VGKPAVYLDYAIACLELVPRMGPEAEPTLLEMAQAWQRLAEEMAAKEATLVPQGSASNDDVRAKRRHPVVGRA
jgi:hypothetical protein